jgi:hypothetical protein
MMNSDLHLIESTAVVRMLLHPSPEIGAEPVEKIVSKVIYLCAKSSLLEVLWEVSHCGNAYEKL